jgi:hypothetical protein
MKTETMLLNRLYLTGAFIILLMAGREKSIIAAIIGCCIAAGLISSLIENIDRDYREK